MSGPEWMIIYGAGIVLVTITAARFVMHELTGAVRQYKKLRSSLKGITKQLPAKKDNVSD